MEKQIDFIEKVKCAGNNVDNYMHLLIKSRSENEKLARNIIASFLLEKNPSVEELADVKTAVSEAVTNSIVHGYKGKEGDIRIEARLLNDLFYIKVEDEGVGIQDIPRAMQPFFTTGPEGERSGMGFTVMETFMDQLQVSCGKGECGGLVVEMVKVLGSRVE